MLQQILLTNSQGSILELNLNDVSSGIVVDSVDGLDPVKATLVSSSFSTLDGGRFQSSRRDVRNIVLHLAIEPNWALETVQTVRKRIYDFFMPKSKIMFQFYDSLTGLNSADISGYVESCETPLFSQEPMVDVSIMCYDPDFVDHNVTTVSQSTVATSATFNIDYTGTVETGIKFALNLNRSLSEFTIKSTTGDGTVRTMDFAYALVSGNVLEVSTVPGNKYVDLIVSGVRTPILYSLARLSKWIDLQPGSNIFNVYAVGAAIPFTISYYKRYGGL